MNRQQYRNCISRAAASFINHSTAYQQAADELAGRLGDIRIQPASIVCAGCRTGLMMPALKRQFPEADIIGCDESQRMLAAVENGSFERLACDLDQLPLADACADLCIMCLPASRYDYDALFQEIKRVIKAEGLLLFAVPGTGSFQRRGDACFDFAGTLNPHWTIDMHNLGDLLLNKGFADPVVDMENLTLTCNTQDEFIQEVRNTGWFDAFDAAEGDGSARGTFQTNLEVVFGIAWIAADTRPPLRVDFEG